MPRDALSAKLEMHAPDPLYRQIEKQILQCLAQGEWKPGDRLPTETQLAERFGVSVFTVRGGISQLAAANILVRRQGKGTFVARHGRQRRRYQFTHVFRNDGSRISPERKLIAFARTLADKEIMALLQLGSHNRPVYRIGCVLKAGTHTIAVMEITVPCHLFSGLSPEVIRNSEENLYAVYQEACGVNVIRIEERVHAVRAEARAAKTLGIAADDPVLRIDRIAYTYNDVPVEFRRRIHEASNYHYQFSEGGV